MALCPSRAARRYNWPSSGLKWQVKEPFRPLAGGGAESLAKYLSTRRGRARFRAERGIALPVARFSFNPLCGRGWRNGFQVIGVILGHGVGVQDGLQVQW